MASALQTKRGWVEDGKWLYGYYRTRHGSFTGKIRRRLFHLGDFFIHNPPRELRSHEHWQCFDERGEGWFELHFSTEPNTLDDGIKTIERMIADSFRMQQRGIKA